MSKLIGIFRCPECLNREWEVQDWETYMSIVCARCGHKLGEMGPENIKSQRTQA